MYTDTIKIFTKNEKEQQTFIIYNQEIGIEVRVEKCAMLLMKKT